MSKDESKRIVITGATRGLGRAMAEGFAQLGHTVLGCGRSQKLVDELQEQLPGHHDFSQVDVADYASVKAWASRLLSAGDAPDLLVNNAALMNQTVALWEVEPDEFHSLVDVNISGVYHVIRAFVPAMISRGSGVIVNFSSGRGRSTSPNVAPYCATKWAIEGMTRSLSQELPDGLAAIPLNPGIIDTDMLRSAWGEGAASYPSPNEWAKRAVPTILGMTAEDSGRAMSV